MFVFALLSATTRAIILAILLADRTNGRAIATLLRLSSSSLSVTLCIVAKRCVLRYDTIEEINVDSKAEYTA